MSETEGGRSRAVFSSVTGTFVLASIFAVGRLVCRFGIVKRYGWDDYSFILAWILAFGLSFSINFSTYQDIRVHDDNINADLNTRFLGAEHAAIVLFYPALMMTKASILLLYLDIARYSQKFLRIGSYVTLVLSSVGGFVLSFMSAFRCRPVQAAYNLSIQHPSCIPIQSILLSSAPINIATDLAILVLPIPGLTTLPVSLLRRTTVISTFMLGVIAVTVVDVARIYYLQLATVVPDQPPGSQLSTGLHSSYHASIALFLSAIEVNVAIIGAAIPTLGPLLKRLILTMAWYGFRDDTNGALVRSASEEETRDSHSRAELSRQPSSATDRAFAYRSKAISTTIAVDDRSQVDIRGLPAGSDIELAPQRSRVPPVPQECDYAASFGFTEIVRPKCLVDIRGLECVKYCTIVNSLLFLNGFTYVLLFSINASIPVVGSRTQAIGMVSASYGGAGLFAPILAYSILRYVGFKSTCTTALAVCCAGTLIFWPSGAMGSYPGFLISSVVVGVALASLEIAANAFNALCGPSEYAVIRVLLGTGVEIIGGVVAFSVAHSTISISPDDPRSVIGLQWAYFAIALSTVLWGLFFYYLPLPEATDTDLRSRPDLLWVDPSHKYFGTFPVVLTPLAIAIVTIFFTTGALSSLRISIASVSTAVETSTLSAPLLRNADFQTVITATHAGGHFFLAFLCFLIPPRLVLLGALRGADPELMLWHRVA
ncbi:hypothetical protein DL764_004128 [Monosporascus ibericus]|uniref:Rhodopsin domain-containing protein n=1 Tax=Monosporascus ibericus TaxID=155417 RepID=A0A4Q4TEG9_9PEZI|nr:hypothetical protein DL764_004128 [Monosporascus ibericus]